MSSLAEFVQKHQNDLENIAVAVRILGMDAVLKAKSGHVGLPLGGAEMGTLLYFAVMHSNPQSPRWLDRDRFVLSAGHGSMLQYALLHLAGYNVSKEEIVRFRQLNSQTPGHPEYGHTPGIECTTGPLGQGLATSVGMAIAERMLAARFGDMIDHRTYVLAGDGCLMEGVTSEACSLAGHLKLNRLIVLYDANNITIDGTIDLTFTEQVNKRYESYGFEVLHADGNDFASLAAALDKAHHNANQPNGTKGPTLIVCKGVPGKGSPKWEGKHKVHGNPMSAQDVIDAKIHLGVTDTEPFAVPQKCIESAQKLMALRTQKARVWQERLELQKQRWKAEAPHTLALWQTLIEKPEPAALDKSGWELAKGTMATRQSGQKALLELAKHNPALVGGSADLAGSNLTTLSDSAFITPTDFSGRNIHFGVREHAMGAVCNGITLHGALRGYCATFLVFSDYMRPAIRLAALMHIPTIFIFTHDSYAVGEDGPTHQPIEHAASLRAMPNLQVYRPADTLETFAAWESAVLSHSAPTALLLTRQDVPELPERSTHAVQEGMSAGAYLLKDFGTVGQSQQRITLVASGSEVSVALKTAETLESKSYVNSQHGETTLAVRVVSAPAPQVLVRNPAKLNTLVPKEYPIVAIEAGATQSFGEIVGRSGAIFGLNQFGASAPYQALAEHFGFTPEKFAQFVLNQLALRPRL